MQDDVGRGGLDWSAKGIPDRCHARLRAPSPGSGGHYGPDEFGKAALTEADRRTACDIGIRFLGARDDVARLYAGMDILVLGVASRGLPTGRR